MTNANILRTLKAAAGSCKWTRKEGRFMAVHGNRGMYVSISNLVPRHQIVTRALAVQRELIDAKKGVLDAETQELWDRQTGEPVDTRAALEAMGGPGK